VILEFTTVVPVLCPYWTCRAVCGGHVPAAARTL